MIARAKTTKRPAPAFTLANQLGERISLKEFRGQWVVLYFYPHDDTPGCTLEAREFTSLLGQFDELNAAVVGISPAIFFPGPARPKMAPARIRSRVADWLGLLADSSS